MILILAGLASLALSTDPGFIAGAVAEYCEPFVRDETSLDQARDRLVAAGFTVASEESYADPIRVIEDGREPPPDFPARLVRLHYGEGATVSLLIDQEGPGCLAAESRSNSDALTRAIEATGRWLAIPGTRHDWMPLTEAQWLSPDGRLILTSDLEDNSQGDWTYAHLRQASAPPDRMLAGREAIFSADRRSPGSALVSAVQDMCLAGDYDVVEDREHRLARIAASGGTTNGGLRFDFRHRDPETTITWIYADHCLLGAWGAGLDEATAEIRDWLNDPASGWSRGDQADVWIRPGVTATLKPTDDGEAVLVNVRTADAPEE
ncbi:MAG: hypothetical protein HYU62_11685 [Caulobacterales bacterium]|nr:hypothetical protein [Caulobacterales bacterium]